MNRQPVPENAETPEDAVEDRYSRQRRFAPLGAEGMRRLAQSRVAVVGCGALGSMICERLARSGVGMLRIIDRDWVELSNLQRQTLFTEQDALDSVPKAIAAAQALGEINSVIQVEPVVEDVTYETLPGLTDGIDVVVDGTDNFETRFLINDLSVARDIPWVHGGCLGSSGQIMTILPGDTACFRCLMPEMPPRDALETCDSAGVLGPAVGIIACWQAAEALKILSGNPDEVCRGLIVLDTWFTETRIVKLHRNANCPTCGLNEFPFLDGAIRSESTILCGKNAVQVELPSQPAAALADVASRFATLGRTTSNSFFVRLFLPNYTITVFKGGRTVVEGTTDVSKAKSLLAQTLGS